MKRVLVRPFDDDSFEVALNYDYKDIVVPKGYKTNGADIPRFLWCVYPPNSPEYLSAVVIHDFLCDKREFKKADEYLKEAMTELKCGKFKTLLFYFACRFYHKLRYEC